LRAGQQPVVVANLRFEVVGGNSRPGLFAFWAINRSLLELQVGPLEGTDHCDHQPIMRFIGI
jgi:hypothetical protein